MAENNYESLTPLPFLPIIGKFDLTTYVPGSSDYEIMARVIETYNKAVSLFNQLLADYGDFDQKLNQLGLEYDEKLNAYKVQIDTEIENFERNTNTTINNFTTDINTRVQAIETTLAQLKTEVDKLTNGDYIEIYVNALSEWIDNNLQQLVAKLVKYVWFALDDEGRFVAYIPDKWDFIDFDTITDPDSPDYGKLALEWETAVVQ